MRISKVGVIGAGQMGNGIAHVCALAGYDVALNDISQERIEAGLATINGNLARRVKSGKLSEGERDAALKRIRPASGFEQLGDCDLVIESAVEDEQVKRKIYAAVCPHLAERAILGTNTSSISITRLAATTRSEERR